MKKNSWFLSLGMFMFTILLSGCQEEVQSETAQDNASLTRRGAAHGRAGSVTPEFTFTALHGGPALFRFFPYGPFTQLSIDWGDGTQEVINGEPREGIGIHTPPQANIPCALTRSLQNVSTTNPPI